jgi:hypothetical protein
MGKDKAIDEGGAGIVVTLEWFETHDISGRRR